MTTTASTTPVVASRTPAQPTAASAGASGLSPLGLFVLLSGALLSITDFFIVNVALPDIHATFGASSAALEMVITGYGVGYALLLVVGGRWGDAIGRKRMFLWGMAAFTVMSLACGLAPTVGTLVAFRVVQGISAAMMVPQVMATIQATTSGEQRAKALGWYGATAGIAAVVGQVLGGLLVSADIAGTGWRPIFFVNVPIGIAALVAAHRILPETRSAAPARPDAVGTVLLGAFVVTLLVPLMEGRALGWPIWSILMLAASPVLLAAFVLTERHLERRGVVPLVPPSLVRVPGMARGLLLAVPFFAGFGAFMFEYAIAMQQGLGHSAFGSGLVIAPMAVSFLLASMATGRLVGRYGSTLLSVGALIQVVGLVATALVVLQGWPSVSIVELAITLTIAGLGQGLMLSPLFGVVLSKVPVTEAGIGSGILVTTQQIALAVGVATLGNVFISISGRPGVDSMGHAWAFGLGMQALIGLGFAVAARTLPRGR